MTTTIPSRPLGRDTGLTVSALGLGCMGMSFAYGPADEGESLRVLGRYLELGGNFLDTAEIYGPWKNEELLGKFFRQSGKRDQVVLATKFGFKLDEQGNRLGADSSPENVKRACEGSLKRLGVDLIDLFYQHRVDPNVPIEDTVGAMAELVQAGKVRALGLSEAAPDTLRRASKIHPIAALQSEYSLWTRDPETNGVLDTCRELGITFIPYSPLGRGFLTGTIKKIEDLPSEDWRRTNPRFARGAFENNLRLANAIRAIADGKAIPAAQLALAWVLAQGDDIVPIPGTKRVKYLQVNMGALNVSLSQQDMHEIELACTRFKVEGERYPAAMMDTVHK